MAVPGGPPLTPGYPEAPKIRFDAIGEAWRLFQPQMGTWIVAELVFILGIVLAYVVSIALFFVTGAAIAGIARAIPFAPIAGAFTAFIPMVLIFTVMNVLLAGLYNMALKQIRGEAIAVGDMFAMTDRLGSLIVAALLTALIVAIGCILCYIPGLIAAAMLMFTIPLIVDRRMDAIEAMKLSFETLKGEIVMATLFYVVVSIVGGVGGIACGIGALFTWPLFFLSIVLVYRAFFTDSAATAYPIPTPPPDTQTPPPPPVP